MMEKKQYLKHLKSDFEGAFQNSLRSVNQLVMEEYAKALKAAPNPLTPDSIQSINQRLDNFRKPLLKQAHEIFLSNITKSNPDFLGVLKENHKRLPKLLKKTTASPNDIVYISPTQITWSSGNNVSSHDRNFGVKFGHQETFTHAYVKGDVIENKNPRFHSRIPSLAVKHGWISWKKSSRYIQDVALKLTKFREEVDLVNKYDELNPTQGLSKPKAFVYNLYTALNDLDDPKNTQSQSASYILKGAHQYNKQQFLLDPLGGKGIYCFVQNISVNGKGSALGYKPLTPLVNEATLMTEMALMHTLISEMDTSLFFKIKKSDQFDNNLTLLINNENRGLEITKIIEYVDNIKTKNSPDQLVPAITHFIKEQYSLSKMSLDELKVQQFIMESIFNDQERRDDLNVNEVTFFVSLNDALNQEIQKRSFRVALSSLMKDPEAEDEIIKITEYLHKTIPKESGIDEFLPLMTSFVKNQYNIYNMTLDELINLKTNIKNKYDDIGSGADEKAYYLTVFYSSLDTVVNQEIQTRVFIEYENFLKDCKPGQFFSQDSRGIEAIKLIKECKNTMKTETFFIRDEQDVLSTAKYSLIKLFAHDRHFRNDATLFQALSVFCEKMSAGGCKSAIDRTPMINNRVAMLDRALNEPDTNVKELKELSGALYNLAKASSETEVIDMEKALETALNTAVNHLGLQTQASMQTNAEIGGAAKYMAKINSWFRQTLSSLRSLFDRNYAESAQMDNTAQKNATQVHHSSTTKAIIKASKKIDSSEESMQASKKIDPSAGIELSQLFKASLSLLKRNKPPEDEDNLRNSESSEFHG